uniref:Uncharacterized protein n=1 Tax=Anabas testudineus TaxID=64144 RepID=A0A3Q1IUG7_ANATE
MPLFRWMKWSHDTRADAQDEAQSLKTSRVVPSCMLIRELLWHVEEQERMARELEWEHRLAHSTLGLHWCQYPRLRTLIPTSELHQLEFLCSQIPPIHAASVLTRFREVLADNNIRPWELAPIFKQVLKDFLRQKQFDAVDDLSGKPGHLQPIEDWTSYHPREEIPTISAYVDRAMRHSSSFTANRDWDLPPYYYPASPWPKGAYSTTL